jgi:hypothetical protein
MGCPVIIFKPAPETPVLIGRFKWQSRLKKVQVTNRYQTSSHPIAVKNISPIA